MSTPTADSTPSFACTNRQRSDRGLMFEAAECISRRARPSEVCEVVGYVQLFGLAEDSALDRRHTAPKRVQRHRGTGRSG